MLGEIGPKKILFNHWKVEDTWIPFEVGFNGFYNQLGPARTTTSATPEKCKSCDNGIIWK